MIKETQVKLIVDGTILRDGTVIISTDKIKGLDVLDENNNPMPVLWKIEEMNRFAIDCKLSPVADLEVERLIKEAKPYENH